MDDDAALERSAVCALAGAGRRDRLAAAAWTGGGYLRRLSVGGRRSLLDGSHPAARHAADSWSKPFPRIEPADLRARTQLKYGGRVFLFARRCEPGSGSRGTNVLQAALLLGAHEHPFQRPA